jgi:hypothetical protein
VSNIYACSGRTQNRRVDKMRRVEDRRRHVTRYHENVRVIVEVKSEYGGRLARSWSRSTYPYAGWIAMQSLEFSQRPVFNNVKLPYSKQESQIGQKGRHKHKEMNVRSAYV